MRQSIVLLACAAVTAAACHWDLNDPGTEPPPSQFAYPAPLVIDPDGVHLYVASANSDLRYGGGMLQVVDTARWECARQAFLKTSLGADCDATQAMTDAAVCKRDPEDPQAVDCDESPFVLANSTVKLGNFATRMVMQRTADKTRTLFIGVRGDPSVTYVDVDWTADATRPGVLLCVDDPSRLTARDGYDATTNTTKKPIACDASHLLQEYPCTGKVSCTDDIEQIPVEPFGMFLDQGKLPNGDPYARLLVSHLQGGEIQLIDALVRPPTVTYVSDPIFDALDASNRRGAFSLAPQLPGVSGSTWYVTSNLQATVSTFRVAELDVVVPGPRFTVRGAFSNGTDVRDITFEPGGQRAFFTQDRPPSLAVLDTSPQPTSTGPGLPRNQVSSLVSICQSPSHFAVRRIGNETRIYVACFLNGQVMVVDPDQLLVEDTIIVGRGPNDIALNFASDALDTPDPAHRRGYVSNFSEATIAVIDLDPGSDTYNRVIGRIGQPVKEPKL